MPKNYEDEFWRIQESVVAELHTPEERIALAERWANATPEARVEWMARNEQIKADLIADSMRFDEHYLSREDFYAAHPGKRPHPPHQPAPTPLSDKIGQGVIWALIGWAFLCYGLTETPRTWLQLFSFGLF